MGTSHIVHTRARRRGGEEQEQEEGGGNRIHKHCNQIEAWMAPERPARVLPHRGGTQQSGGTLGVAAKKGEGNKRTRGSGERRLLRELTACPA